MTEYVATIGIYDSSDSPEEVRDYFRLLGYQANYSLVLHTREERMERAKTEARRMLGGLMPGNTGNAMADEVAENVIKAADSTDVEGEAKADALSMARAAGMLEAAKFMRDSHYGQNMTVQEIGVALHYMAARTRGEDV